MKLLIRHVRVADPASPFNGQSIDLFIEDGQIKQIAKELSIDGAEIWDGEGAWVSPGWVDVGAFVPDPGFEQRETFTSAGQAAAVGGFTRVAVFPNSNPVVDGKQEVLYVKRANPAHPVEFLPIGALSVECKGKDITEMLDMSRAGAVAFSDGLQAIQGSGMMLRVLEYTKSVQTVVIQQPHDLSMAPYGQIHEGQVSTSLGLQGIPVLSETLMIERDLSLLVYADSRLHIHGVSSAEGVGLVRLAKQKGLQVSCSTPSINLLYTEERLANFDAALKLMPPLRSETDRKALQEGLLDGTIDIICSNHLPLEEEKKKLEFSYAEFGAIGLETAFPILLKAVGERIDAQWVAHRLGIAPCRILGLEPGKVAEGQLANLTLFSMEQEQTWQIGDFKSLSSNTPIYDQTLPGKVLGVIHRGHAVHLSP